MNWPEVYICPRILNHPPTYCGSITGYWIQLPTLHSRTFSIYLICSKVCLFLSASLWKAQASSPVCEPVCFTVLFMCHISDSTYEYHMLFVSLWLLSLAWQTLGPPYCCKWHLTLFMAEQHSAVHTHLCPFICWGTCRSLPCFDYRECCCNEHRGACIFSKQSITWVYAQDWDC